MILAAGKGERLAPLTDSVPKPLIEIGGETLIERHLRALASAGFSRIVVNLAHLGEKIARRLGDGKRFGVDIVYSREPDGPLETAGGIVHALPLLGRDPFLIVNADIWTAYPFARLCEALPPGETATAHLVLVPNPEHNPGGDFSLAGARVECREHNSATYAGIAVYRPEFFAGTPPGRRPLGPLLTAAAGRGEVLGELYAGRWLDVGTPERLADARRLVTDTPPGQPPTKKA